MKALMKMKKGNENIYLKNVSEPNCMKDDIKIEIKFSGICGTDLHILHDLFESNPPVILGHEISGIVTEIGSNIKNFKIGDRVAVLGSNAEICGKCSFCKTGYYIFCPKRKGMGIHVDGGFTKYVTCREDMVYKLPEFVSMKEGALYEPLACGVQAIEELGNVKVGDNVLVSGPGPVGLICTALLAMKGCKIFVAGTSLDETRLKIAKDLGADVTINVNDEELENIIMTKTNNRGVDVTIDCSGNSNSLNSCLKVLSKKGEHIQVGILGSQATIDIDLIVYKQIKFYGSLAHSIKTWDRVSKIMEKQKINLSPIITHTLSLDQWEEGFRLSEEKRSGKVLLTYD